MPRKLAEWYVTRIRKVIRVYDVQDLIGYKSLLDIVESLGCKIRYSIKDEYIYKMANPQLINRSNLKWVSRFFPASPKFRRILVKIYTHFMTKSWWILAQKGVSNELSGNQPQ